MFDKTHLAYLLAMAALMLVTDRCEPAIESEEDAIWDDIKQETLDDYD